MNEFIEQFLVESRELVEQATADLLALEERPGDRERLDSAFRAFHTLKGAAGIVEFDAMARALHAAEDVLAQVRAGAAPVTPALIGDSLTCLDQVLRWLDAMEPAGEIPVDADAAADALVRRFAKGEAEGPSPAPSAPAGWVEALLARHPDAGAAAAAALRYTPDRDAFFRGEDPLARLAELPGLLALDMASVAPWPPLEALDPFACQLVFEALLASPAAAGALGAGAELVELSPAPPAGRGLSGAAQAIVSAQLQLLAAPAGDGQAGRLASAARVGANVMRRLGRPADAVAVEQALAVSVAAGLEQPLAAALQNLLDGKAVEASGEDEAETAGRGPEPVARALRVDVERIDALVNLAGELIVAKNAIGHLAGLAESGTEPRLLAAALKDRHAQLERLVAELQRSVLAVRVLPLRHVFQRFPRLVREMALSLAKPVRLLAEGDETEADKAVVEALFEPLLHVIRNAMDHGIEPADERAVRGKPALATLHLRGRRVGEHVVVEVEDDGAGVNLARVRAVAVERGVVSAEAAPTLADAAAVELIFAPGFSTAASVTGLSGRGVGMDAVRAAVERLGGRVAVVSRPGEGTLVRFTLPFTVMMTQVMTVEADGQAFGVPLDAVVETARVPREAISAIGAARAFVWRDRTVPLLDLSAALGRPATRLDGREMQVVVVSAAGQLVGLEVERVGGRMDVMLKPVEGLLSGMPGIAGTTLLGDGRVLVVLDVQELVT